MKSKKMPGLFVMFYALVHAVNAVALLPTSSESKELGDVKHIEFYMFLRQPTGKVKIAGRSASPEFLSRLKKLMGGLNLDPIAGGASSDFTASEIAVIEIKNAIGDTEEIVMYGGVLVRINKKFYNVKTMHKGYDLLREFYDKIVKDTSLWEKK